MIRVTYSKTGVVIVGVIDRDLRAATVPIVGVSWNEDLEQVTVDYDDSATSGDITTGEAIVAAHVPVDPWFDVQEGAETQASNIPGWASWSEGTADTWYQSNVRDPFDAATTFATMKAVVGTMITVQWAIIRMVIALRNKTWPNLQE